VYVRYVDEAKVKEDLLFCKEIILSNTAQDLFDIINTYMTMKLLGWSDCVRLFTDRTRSMSGICGRLQTLICQTSPCAVWIHYMIHERALASKHLSQELENVLQIVPC
jgi:hypothetical protein